MLSPQRVRAINTILTTVIIPTGVVSGGKSEEYMSCGARVSEWNLDSKFVHEVSTGVRKGSWE